MSERLRAAFAKLDEPRGRRTAVTAVVSVLLLATAAAFGFAERLKLERSPVTAPRLTRLLAPTCGCAQAHAELRITLREPDRIDVSIVDTSGDPVRVLASDLRRPRGVATFDWDGRDEAGEVVRDGRYRLRIRLRENRRTITVPTPIRVDATPPRVRLVEASPRVMSPDGDGRGDRVLYEYRTREHSYPILFVNGERVIRGPRRPPGPSRLRWGGRVDDEPARPGSYDTWLVVVDDAGNRSPPTPVVGVRVRYVEVAPARLRIPRSPSARVALRIDADAKTVAWTLGRPGGGAALVHGTTPPGRVSLPVGVLPPGRLVFEAAVEGHVARSVVVVERRR